MIITILSKALGFAREVVLSYYYGASTISDAYFISLTIPTVIFSFISIGIATGYVPIYNRIEKEKGLLASNKFTINIINILIMFCTLFIIVCLLFTEPLVNLFAAGFDESTMRLAILFTRISLFSVYFTGVISILNGFLQLKNDFLIPSFLGFIYNLLIILSIYISFKYSVIFLAIGSVIAAVFQVIFIIYFVKKQGLNYEFYIDLKNQDIKFLGKMMLPLTFGLAINQINVLFDKNIASTIALGGVSALNYADRLNSFILSTIVMTISSITYPLLSKSFANGDINNFKKIVNKSMTWILIALIPATCGILIFSELLVKLLFARGAFSNEAISMTTDALFYYSIGMIWIGIREILTRAFYAIEDTKTPMVNAAIGMCINVVLNIILSKIIGIGGLALATSISAFVTTLLLFIELRLKIGPLGYKKIFNIFFKISFISLIMSIIVKLLYAFFINNIGSSIALVLSIIVGIIFFCVSACFAKINEIELIVYSLIKRIKPK